MESARKNGEYAEEKLDFLDRFLPPALNMTASKPQRWYVDLFAGPGLSVRCKTGDVQIPLRCWWSRSAMQMVPDRLWEILEPLLPADPPKPKGGRPRIENRAVLAGILFVLRTGCP